VIVLGATNQQETLQVCPGMIDTFQALIVAVIAVLPGAVYTIARESHEASWAWRKTDAATLVFRFLTRIVREIEARCRFRSRGFDPGGGECLCRGRVVVARWS
jgi:hypothetical protein